MLRKRLPELPLLGGGRYSCNSRWGTATGILSS